MSIVFGEKDYAENMETIVLPYIKARETERYVEREEGKPLHLCVYQADEAGAAVVISHGFTESIVKYQEVIYYFLTAGYHVYMAEHCGHGKSYRLTEDPYLVYVDDYHRYVEDLLFIAHQCKEAYPDLPLYLFAHSMGGGIGAAAISEESELFDKAVLTSPMIRPSTGNIPWFPSKVFSVLMNRAGHELEYVMGQKPYDGTDTYDTSCATSKARFDYYKKLRDTDVTLQTCAASFGWAGEAVRLNTYLRKKGWKKVRIPVLLFQAEKEELVSKPEQNRYIRKMYRYGKQKVSLVIVKDSKHEIFNATQEIQEKYWKKIFHFLA